MTIEEIIKLRRAYRALEKVEITEELIMDLALNAQLSASCFNYQPWHFVFVFEKEKLTELFEVLSSNNQWAKKASMIIAVVSKKELDCVIGTEREYYLFDTGMATAFLILRGTELGLVIHPIAGYDQSQAKKILSIPDEMTLITLLIVGKKTSDLSSLTEKQVSTETKRPPRKDLKEFIHLNNYTK
ncbi:MAG: nitroreductase family protein [Candidatus Heimdallarchaeota archaeon]|nr:nitroreductase family protein [Candidatus Heimdallarchaeota archaeon]